MFGEYCEQLLRHDVRGIIDFHGSALGDYISSAVGAFGPRKAGALGEVVKRMIVGDMRVARIPSTIVQPQQLLERNGPFQWTW